MQMKFYTAAQIAKLLNMSQYRVYEAVREGLLPAVHIGRQIRVEESAFIQWARGGGQRYAGGWRRQTG